MMLTPGSVQKSLEVFTGELYSITHSAESYTSQPDNYEMLDFTEFIFMILVITQLQAF
jgi:hypothetical protein